MVILLLLVRRDEALAAIQDSIRQQQQQELSIETEIHGFKKDINKEQVCVLHGHVIAFDNMLATIRRP